MQRMLEQRADGPLAAVGQHLAVGSGQQDANRDPVRHAVSLALTGEGSQPHSRQHGTG